MGGLRSQLKCDGPAAAEPNPHDPVSSMNGSKAAASGTRPRVLGPIACLHRGPIRWGAGGSQERRTKWHDMQEMLASRRRSRRSPSRSQDRPFRRGAASRNATRPRGHRSQPIPTPDARPPSIRREARQVLHRATPTHGPIASRRSAQQAERGHDNGRQERINDRNGGPQADRWTRERPPSGA